MKILHTSDWHLGKNLEQISRIGEQREFVDYLVRLVEGEEIDLVLIAGDIFDTYNPSAAAEELFYAAVERLNAKGTRAVVVIAGNHDNPERLCASSPLAYKHGIVLLGYPGSDAGQYQVSESEIAILNSGPGWLELQLPGCAEKAVILTLPYPSESRLSELLEKSADESILQQAYSAKINSILTVLSENFREDTVNLLVGHLFMLGGRSSDSERTISVGGALTVDPAVLPAKAHYAALGHLHRPQEIKGSPCPAYYSGSPLGYSFSEADYSKAVYVIEAIPGQKTDIKPIYLPCGRPLKRWIAEQGYAQALEWCREGRDENAWIDLEIVTQRVLTLEEQKELRSLHAGIVNIRPRLKGDLLEVFSPESREGRKIEKLFSDYYAYRFGTEITDELLTAFLTVLNDEDSSLLKRDGEVVNVMNKSNPLYKPDGGESFEA